MANGAIELEHWGQFQEQTKEAWRELIRQHGLDPEHVGFPLVFFDDGTMIVREWLRNERGMHYIADGDVAFRWVELELQTEVGLPAICRED